MKIAYVLNTYPEGSHSFIRREIGALERLGHDVLRLAMRRPLRAPSDPQDISEAQRTGYILEAGAVRLGWAALRGMVRAFGPSRQSIALAVRVGRGSDTGVIKHLIYLAEAFAVARRCQQAGVDHIHAHFGTNAATIAMLAGAISGIPYSFTVHGPEEFDRPEALALGEKITRSAFTVAISQFGRSQLYRWVSSEQWSKIKVVHCGIDPAKFAEGALQPLPGGSLQLVSIGRFAEQKGQVLLLEAIAQVGGLSTTAADPKGVFVFRNEPQNIANAVLGRDDLIGAQRMVYVLDLTKPNGMFHARDFVIRDDDTLYVTEAPFTQWDKTISALTGSASSVSGLTTLGSGG